MVNGSKFVGTIKDGAISGPNYLGNKFMSGCINLLFGVTITDFADFDFGVPVQLVFQNELGASEVIVTNPPIVPDGAEIFFGFIDTANTFSQVQLVHSFPIGGGDAWSIDGVLYGISETPIPEPTTLAMLALGCWAMTMALTGSVARARRLPFSSRPPTTSALVFASTGCHTTKIAPRFSSRTWVVRTAERSSATLDQPDSKESI